MTYANGHTCEGEWFDGERNGWMIFAYPRNDENKGRPLSELFNHKVTKYMEYRAVSGGFRTIDPPSPLPPASVHQRW